MTHDRALLYDLLDRDERRELRDLGWSVARKKAKRPRRVPYRNTVSVEKANRATFVDLEVAQ